MWEFYRLEINIVEYPFREKCNKMSLTIKSSVDWRENPKHLVTVRYYNKNIFIKKD